MNRRLRWLIAARLDLLELLDWIADRSDIDTGEAYVFGVETHALRLTQYPLIGSPRNDLSVGLRSLTHSRRTIIFYRVAADNIVEIVRISHGGRNLDAMFADDDD